MSLRHVLTQPVDGAHSQDDREHNKVGGVGGDVFEGDFVDEEFGEYVPDVSGWEVPGDFLPEFRHDFQRPPAAAESSQRQGQDDGGGGDSVGISNGGGEEHGQGCNGEGKEGDEGQKPD